MIKLMDLLNEESFVAKSTKSGKIVNFGSKETRDAAIKSGDYEEPEEGEAGVPAKPKVNIFDKPADKKAGGDKPKPTEEPTKEPKEKTDYEKGLATKAKEAVGRIGDKIKGWAKEEKEFFKSDSQKGGSKERRSWGQAISDKAAGAWKAVKKGAKHEVEEFKTAGSAVKSLFKGESMDDHQKKALKAVAVKVVTTALFGAATGGIAHGAAAFGKHVAMEFIPHVVGETILKGVGKASLFAGEEEENEDVYMEKFVKMIADKVANEQIPAELMEKFVDSYNEKKQTK
jgi:hypothetical protein